MHIINKQVTPETGGQYAYHKLVFATASPVNNPIIRPAEEIIHQL